jgi:hypothetical protein
MHINKQGDSLVMYYYAGADALVACLFCTALRCHCNALVCVHVWCGGPLAGGTRRDNDGARLSTIFSSQDCVLCKEMLACVGDAGYVIWPTAHFGLGEIGALTATVRPESSVWVAKG